jgi:twinkle protein
MTSDPKKIVQRHVACPCGLSSDAYCVYEDGSGYCFSGNCKKPYYPPPKNEDPEELEVSGNTTYAPAAWRGVTLDTMQTYGVTTKFVNDKPVEIGFPYQNDAIKVRSLDRKHFIFRGEGKGATLFGKKLFNAGSHQSIIVTEGELDALSTFQMLGGRVPVVSIPGAGQARKIAREEFDYLDSFDKIYICFDNDDAGRRASSEFAACFDARKVYHLEITTHKDANDFLVKGETTQFKNMFASARRFLPDGIVSSFSDIERILNEARAKPVATYPFEKLQELTYGIRGGEVVLITAQEGIGKTEILRAIEHHLLKTTDINIGILHLEDDRQRTIQGVATYELGIPCHLPDSNVSVTDVLRAYETAASRDDRIHIYTHFGSDDPDVVLERIRFLAGACECKAIFFDHISIVVSGLEDEDERKKLDYLSTKLKMLAQELDFTLFLVSHVNDNGQTRGSRNIGKVADLRIDLSRNNTALSEQERNTTYLTVSKNRFAGSTGEAGKLFYDRTTGRLTEITGVDRDGLPPNDPLPDTPITKF